MERWEQRDQKLRARRARQPQHGRRSLQLILETWRKLARAARISGKPRRG